MLAGASVIPFGALAAPREPVTSAVVLTHAVQAAARAVLPRETFCQPHVDKKKQNKKKQESPTSPRKAPT